MGPRGDLTWNDPKPFLTRNIVSPTWEISMARTL